MKRSTKKRALVVSLVLALVAVIGAGSLAYFTSTDYKANEFTVGNIDVAIQETGWDSTQEDLYPRQSVTKDPKVTNNGENPCYVRLQITGWDCLRTATPPLSSNNIAYATNDIVSALGADWVLHTDGYFYYMKPVAAGGTTATSVFDSIIIPTDVVNDFSGAQYSIDVTAQAVQSQGAPTISGAADLASWFTTCGF